MAAEVAEGWRSPIVSAWWEMENCMVVHSGVRNNDLLYLATNVGWERSYKRSTSLNVLLQMLLGVVLSSVRSTLCCRITRLAAIGRRSAPL